MTTIKCKCHLCIQNDNGHWLCQRFNEFTDQGTIDLCRVSPMIDELNE